jgi:hypothetical protein
MEIDSIQEPNLENSDWRILLPEWMVQGKIPPAKTEARRIARRAKSFKIVDGELH